MSVTRTARWLAYDDEITKAGLLHQISNVQFLIKEAYECGRIPIIPHLWLMGQHNFWYDIKRNMSRYVAWDEIQLELISGKIEKLNCAFNFSRIKAEAGSSHCILPADCNVAAAEFAEKRLIVKQVDAIMSKTNLGLWRMMNGTPTFTVVWKMPGKFPDGSPGYRKQDNSTVCRRPSVRVSPRPAR